MSDFHPPPHMTPLHVPIPPDLPPICGYPADARFVALFWIPDEVYYNDGRRFGTGASHAFVAVRRHPAVAPHLAPYNLGALGNVCSRIIRSNANKRQSAGREADFITITIHKYGDEFTIADMATIVIAAKFDGFCGFGNA